MSPEEEFRARLNDVSYYLRSLSDIEKRQAKGNGPFYRASAALAASRASSFIMIYNCVEFGIRTALLDIRLDASNVENYDKLRDHWQHEIVRENFGLKLSSGVNYDGFLNDLRSSLPLNPLNLKNVKSLPFSGNINHQRLIEFARKIGNAKWKPPKGCNGGSDLEFVRNARNALAHGEETFENIGSSCTSSDIFEKLARIRKFICSYLKMLERYRTKSHYRR